MDKMSDMAEYDLSYGHSRIKLSLDKSRNVTWLLPSEVPGAANPELVIADALAHPVGEGSLTQFNRSQSVAIAINDKTRPAPHQRLLPPLLRQLENLGIAPDNITLVIATGTHIPTPPDLFADVLPPEIIQRYNVISHDCDALDLVVKGTTSRGTPVKVNRQFAEADFRIVVGNIEPHHFAGFSGGVKSAAIGLAARQTITANHALLLDPDAALAIYDENPLRQDIEEIGQLMDIHLALNIVMNRQKEIVRAFFGPPLQVIRAGLPIVREIYSVDVDQPFDVMITSPGGYPKDINLYQAHKAVSCANRVTRTGGSIILVAACEDGIGSAGYAAWMDEKVGNGLETHTKVMETFVKEPFRIGPHKAYIFARDAVKVRGIWIVSDIAPQHIRGLLLNPATMEEAIDQVIDPLPLDARIGIMPYANATIPYLKGE
ncbi:MAG: nickel-dependent lactate racemase [Anaerolineae bacterium]|nr:nickel-dependent lactate racemase [Anaerolineae bacterium]